MRHYLILLIASGLLLACGKTATIGDVFKSNIMLEMDTINADGTTTDTVSIVLNSDADSNRRNVLFTTTAGTWLNGQNGQVTAPATFINTKLVAKAVLQAPMSAGTIYVTAAPSTASPNGDYTKLDSIIVNKVLPANMDLEPSSFGTGANFTSFDTLVATLKGSAHQKVSTGAQVQFVDVFTNGQNAGGRFRDQVLSSNANSQVSAIYSSAQAPIGTNIYIIVSVTSPTALGKPIIDTVTVTINQ